MIRAQKKNGSLSKSCVGFDGSLRKDSFAITEDVFVLGVSEGWSIRDSTRRQVGALPTRRRIVARGVRRAAHLALLALGSTASPKQFTGLFGLANPPTLAWRREKGNRIGWRDLFICGAPHRK